jgi:hypothetical protein
MMITLRIEMVLAVLFGGLAIVAAFWPTWIETVLRIDPDGGDGSAEWLVLGLLGAAAIVAAFLARRDYRVVISGTRQVARNEW